MTNNIITSAATKITRENDMLIIEIMQAPKSCTLAISIRNGVDKITGSACFTRFFKSPNFPEWIAPDDTDWLVWAALRKLDDNSQQENVIICNAAGWSQQARMRIRAGMAKIREQNAGIMATRWKSEYGEPATF